MAKKTEKALKITLMGLDVPKYEFIGEWSGRDIKLVGRTVSRAYRKHVLAIRRQLQAAVEPVAPLSDTNAA